MFYTILTYRELSDSNREVDLFAELDSCNRGKGWGLKRKEGFQLGKM